MIVQCPECSSRYKVDDNIPPSGGKITCPSCSNSFVVYPEEQQNSDSSQSSTTSVSEYPEDPSDGDDVGAKTEVVSGGDISQYFQDDSDFEEPSEEMFEEAEGSAESSEGGGASKTQVASYDELGLDDDDESDEEASGPVTTSTANLDEENFGDEEPLETTKQAEEQVAEIYKQSDDTAESTDAEGLTQEFEAAAETNERQQSGSGEPNPEHDGPWQLQTDFGLTYEFPDTQSLNEWLEKRESIAGYELATKEGDFHPLDSWPQVSAGASEAEAGEDVDPSDEPGGGDAFDDAMGGGEDIFQQSTFEERKDSVSDVSDIEEQSSESRENQSSARKGKKSLKDTSFSPPSREDRWDQVLKYVYPLVPVLFILMVLLLVQATGVYDIRKAILGSKQETKQQTTQFGNPSGQTRNEGAENDRQDESQNQLANHVDKLIGDAEKAMNENRLQTARDTLTKARQLDSSRPAIYKMLSSIYTKLGQDKKAKKAQEKFESLKQTN